MRPNLEDPRIEGAQLEQRLRGGVGMITSGATVTLDGKAPLINFITLTGAGQNVVLPDPTAAGNRGLMFLIVNTSASALTATLKQSDGTTTLVAVAQNKAALVMSNGVTWTALLGA